MKCPFEQIVKDYHRENRAFIKMRTLISDSPEISQFQKHLAWAFQSIDARDIPPDVWDWYKRAWTEGALDSAMRELYEEQDNEE